MAWTARRWARSPQRSARTSRRSPTRARACATPTRRSSSKRPRRSKGPRYGQESFETAPRRQDAVRLMVYRTNQHIYAQVIDATGGKVLASASTLEKDVRGAHPKGSNKE